MAGLYVIIYVQVKQPFPHIQGPTIHFFQKNLNVLDAGEHGFPFSL